MQPFVSQDWRADGISEWLLLLLRFAVTRDAKDEAAASAMADEIDALGQRCRPSGPRFFRRTTDEVCKAITAPADAERATILKKHLARIDDPRLRRAFAAATDAERRQSPAFSKIDGQRLWAGLRR
jgi:hypothetical protein